MKTILKIFTLFFCLCICTQNVFAQPHKIGGKNMNLDEVKNKDRVIKYFTELAQIPSPSKKEDKVAAKIIEILSSNGISAQKRFLRKRNSQIRSK